jgi:hypothetical protein
MDMSIQTSLSSMAWGRKFLSASVVALLLISVLAFAIPLAPVAHAAVATPTITIDYPYFVVDQIGTRGIVVENPLGNPAITEIRIQVPKDAVAAGQAPSGRFPEYSGFGGVDLEEGKNAVVEGIGPWVVKYVGSLSGGAAGKIALTIPAATAEKTAGVVDAYTLTFVVVFETKDTLTVTKTIYEGRADRVEIALDKTEIKAGETVKITVTAKTADGKIDQGVPLQIWAEYEYDEEKKEVLLGSVVTDSDGKASLTYTPTKAATYIINADVEKDKMDETQDATISPASEGLEVVAAAPTKVSVNIPKNFGGDPDKPINYITAQEVTGITVSLTDAYGNPVEVDVEATVSLYASRGYLNPSLVKILEGSDKSQPFAFTPAEEYGSSAVITATITLPSGRYAGTYSGSSRTLVTSTFAEQDQVTVTPDADIEVEAGKTIEIKATLAAAVKQKGVPITFSLVSYSEGYAGRLSTTATVKTDADGVAKVVLTVDPKAGAYTQVRATVAKPTTADPTNKFSVDSARITTVAGAPAKLLVKTYEDATAQTVKSAVAKGGQLYVVVSLADAYNNPTENKFGVDVQVFLSATEGALSSPIALIKQNEKSTLASGYEIIFTAPTVYTTVTITASTPQVFPAASTTVSVIPSEPIVVITQPAADTTVDTTTDTATVYIAGYAKVSPAQRTDTAITEIKYSLNGAANETVPIISVVEGRNNFNFSLTLEAGKIHTIAVYTKDDTGLESAATRKITVTKQMQPVFPAEIKTPTLVDTAGRTVTAPRAGTLVAIASPIVNKLNTPQQTLYIVQVKDSTGAIVSFNFVSGTIPANTELTFAISWKPTEAGTYTIEVFAWNNFTEAQVLAPMQTITINVA